MLSLRLARGGRPLTQLRRLLLATAAAGAGFVLLCALAYATSHPDRPGQALLRLAWCALPLAATVQLAVAVTRADPATHLASEIRPTVAGPHGARRYGAVSAAVATLLGSVLALGLFLHLRGEISGLPFDGQAAETLAAGQPLPLAAVVTLLALVPLTAAGATAWATGRQSPPAPSPSALTAPAVAARGGGGVTTVAYGTAEGAGGAPPDGAPVTTLTPGGLPRTGSGPAVRDPGVTRLVLPVSFPWGAALLAAGIALGGYAGQAGGAAAEPADGLPMPGALDGVSAGVVVGWMVTAAGLVLLTPGLLMLTGRVLSAGRPRVTRLLAGRGLTRQAERIGTQLGTVCAAGAAALAATRLEGPWFFGPLGAVGAAVVLLGVCGAAAVSAGAVRSGRAPETAALRRLGASRRLLRRAVALRAAAVLLTLGPLAWLVAYLLVLPLG